MSSIRLNEIVDFLAFWIAGWAQEETFENKRIVLVYLFNLSCAHGGSSVLNGEGINEESRRFDAR